MLLFGEIRVKHEVLELFSEREQGDECEKQCHNERSVKIQTADRNNWLKIKRKQPWNKSKSSRDVFDAEQDPTYRHDNEGYDDTRYLPDSIVEFIQSQALQHEPKAVIGSPQNEIPTRAMP